MTTTMLDIGISVGVILAFVLIIWSRITHQTITEVIIDIKEIFSALIGNVKEK